MTLMIGIIVLLIVSTLTTAFSDFLISRAGEQQIAKVRLAVQSHLLHLPVSFFDDHLSGQLASRVINDASIVKSFMANTIPSTITSFVTVIGAFGILVMLDWKMTMLILICFPIYAMLAIPLGKLTERFSAQSQTQLSQLTGISTESLQNARVVKLNTAEGDVLVKFRKAVNRLYKLAVKSDIIYAIAGPVQSLLSFIIILAIILYGGLRVNHNTLSIGTLVSFLIYFFQIISPMSSLALFYSSYKQAMGATEQITAIINTPVEKRLTGIESSIQKKTDNSVLQLKDVSFSYGSHQVLDKINMVFQVKKKIAIVGPSGAGKTTIVNLLTRLYPVKSGKLLLGSVNAMNYDLEEWRDLFAVVTQDNSNISGTIYDNLVFGLSQKPTQQDLVQALLAANLWNDIQGMPLKLNTVIGEQGVKLSGGQRQRLQIAHAYLKNARFIILDEATSNLDADSERLVTASLNKIAKNRTIIAIAHRLSTIADADKIYFVDKEQVLASGTHSELIRKLPSYRRFVKEQVLSTT